VLFRAATASHAYTAALVLLRIGEFTLLDVVSAAYTVAEAASALERFLPNKVPSLLQLIAEAIRIVDDPPAAIVHTFQEQARKKDVINLAAAVHAEAHLLITYNVRDYFPQSGIMRIMAPGQFISASRETIYRNFAAG
jgi:hypothetical protein